MRQLLAGRAVCLRRRANIPLLKTVNGTLLAGFRGAAIVERLVYVWGERVVSVG